MSRNTCTGALRGYKYTETFCKKGTGNFSGDFFEGVGKTEDRCGKSRYGKFLGGIF